MLCSSTGSASGSSVYPMPVVQQLCTWYWPSVTSSLLYFPVSICFHIPLRLGSWFSSCVCFSQAHYFCKFSCLSYNVFLRVLFMSMSLTCSSSVLCFSCLSHVGHGQTHYYTGRKTESAQYVADGSWRWSRGQQLLGADLLLYSMNVLGFMAVLHVSFLLQVPPPHGS